MSTTPSPGEENTQDLPQPQPRAPDNSLVAWEPSKPKSGSLPTTCLGVLVAPVQTLRRVVEHRPTGWAINIIVFLGALDGVIDWSTGNAWTRAFGAEGPDNGFSIGAAMAGAVISPAVLTILIAFFAAVVTASSRVLGGKGPYAGLFSGFVFAYLPSLLFSPFQLAAMVLGLSESGLPGVVVLGLWLWSLVLAVIAVRENNGFRTLTAIAAFVIPTAMLMVFLFALLVFAVFYLAPALQ
ncbi:MAG: YIP1 family protein [SAR202 cluster bacterium]|nr:YIP1 family protein [SAR202 cluster bacterium]